MSGRVEPYNSDKMASDMELNRFPSSDVMNGKSWKLSLYTKYETLIFCVYSYRTFERKVASNVIWVP